MGVPLFMFLIILFALIWVIGDWVGVYCALFDSRINHIAKDYTYQPKVSVVLSCFNESEETFKCLESIVNSNYPKDKLEIIAYDDCSPDDTWMWIQKAAAKWPDLIIAKKNEVNLGKCFTHVNMAKEATGEVMISVDSDTIIDVNCVREIMAVYAANPNIGGVGGQIRIKNINDSLITQHRAIQYASIFFTFKTIENMFKSSRCLMGPCTSFRTEVYRDLIEHIEARNFLGIRITYGEDTFATMTLNLGTLGPNKKKWYTWNELDAIAWTGQPATITKYLNQQMRWRRSAVNMMLFAAKRMIKGLTGTIPFSAIVVALPYLVLVVTTMTYFLYHVLLGDILQFVFMCMALTWPAITLRALIYNRYVGKFDTKVGRMKNPVLVGMFAAIWLPVSWIVITFFAMFTLDDGGWVTRQTSGNE